jgi:hypothetical protein
MAGAPGTPAAAPPPLPPQAAFFVAAHGEQTGPFDMSALREQAGSGAFTRESLVWKQGMDAWTAAAHVPELAALFPPSPPPLP